MVSELGSPEATPRDVSDQQRIASPVKIFIQEANRPPEISSVSPLAPSPVLPRVSPLPTVQEVRSKEVPLSKAKESVSAHRPFRDEFVKIRELQNTGASIEPMKRQLQSGVVQAQNPAPLSSLKLQAKKDKGPSTENLSSLKTLIDAAFARQENKESKENNQPAPVPPEKNIVEAPAKTIPTIPKAPLAPPALLDDAPSAQALNEVPEAVLRGVLAD
jgi:hypothetical protein